MKETWTRQCRLLCVTEVKLTCRSACTEGSWLQGLLAPRPPEFQKPLLDFYDKLSQAPFFVKRVSSTHGLGPWTACIAGSRIWQLCRGELLNGIWACGELFNRVWAGDAGLPERKKLDAVCTCDGHSAINGVADRASTRVVSVRMSMASL